MSPLGVLVATALPYREDLSADLDRYAAPAGSAAAPSGLPGPAATPHPGA